MDLTDHDTDYRQLIEDTDERIELQHTDMDLEYLGMPRRRVGGLDMRGGSTSARLVDLLGIETEGAVYAWAHSFDADVDISHGSVDRLYLRSSEGAELRGHGIEADTVELSRSEWDSIDLSGSEIRELRVEDASIREIDFSDASIDRLRADQDYGFEIDAGTDIDAVPDAIEGIRAYEHTTEDERDLLLAASEERADELLTEPRYQGTAGSLRAKGLLEKDARTPSEQGRELLRYID